MAQVHPEPPQKEAFLSESDKDGETRTGSRTSNPPTYSSNRNSTVSGTKDEKTTRGYKDRASVVMQARQEVRHGLKNMGWYESKLAVRLRKLVKSRLFTCTIMISLFVALFLGDIFAIIQVPTNTEQDVILTVVFFFFFFEWCVLCATDWYYIFGFFFWMDLIGTFSMIFDVSYVLGKDFTKFNVGGSAGTESVILVRATRAAKLGARAGRLSRVLKILRFLLPFIGIDTTDEGRERVARVISGQLTNVLSTRVAFLTICIAVILPVFSIFLYPAFDDSMDTWAQLLAENANEYWSLTLPEAVTPESEISEARREFLSEIDRFKNFYKEYDYGPFGACNGDMVGDTFTCFESSHFAYIDFGEFTFSEPSRNSSVWQYTYGRFQAEFSLVRPKQDESIINLALMVFIILIMCGFGLVMSHRIGVVALNPLERMLAKVRQRCGEIFKYTADLQEKEDDNENDDEEQEYDDIEQDSEFKLLEKAVEKLAGIVETAVAQKEPKVEDMTADEKMGYAFLQGDQAPQSSPEVPTRQTLSSDSKVDEPDDTDEVDVIQLAHQGIPECMQEELLTETFDTVELEASMRVPVATYLLCAFEHSMSWVKTFVKMPQMIKFATICESKYPANPFHSITHGLDCMFSIYRYMELIEAWRFLPEQSCFWILVAGIAHDLGHPGVNNQFLIDTSHELAMKYNDHAPLENMHCSTMFMILADHEANIFAHVSRDTFKEIRKGVIGAILHTDMSLHFGMVKDLTLLYEMNSDMFDGMTPETVVKGKEQMVLNALIHTADVNNPMKPWDLAYKLALKCVEEFFHQGDLEKEEGVPVQALNDRNKVSTPNAQLGFIEFLILPLVEGVVKVFPQLDALAKHLGSNMGQWANMRIEEVRGAGNDAEVDKVKARKEKVLARTMAVTREGRKLEN